MPAREHQSDYHQNGLVLAEDFGVSLKALQEISGTYDIHQLDHELDHLREIGLLDGGFHADSINLDAALTPTPLALNMYVRCRGSRQSPIEFFALEEK
ncbi:hypothetical protein WME89_43175 [Sorangium sp. So ce321]|uniref:hypothetical protein n=1 Tax=Sorangium sp. So ce321 TaxID=3133300 RepID=UPI003F5F2188